MKTIPEEVVRRFAYKRQLGVNDAQQLFQELETFLDHASTCVATPSSRIDDAWHEFILHTKDYGEFCRDRYGRLVHHVPTSPLSCEGDTGEKKCSSGLMPNERNPLDALQNAKCKSCASDCQS